MEIHFISSCLVTWQNHFIWMRSSHGSFVTKGGGRGGGGGGLGKKGSLKVKNTHYPLSLLPKSKGKKDTRKIVGFTLYKLGSNSNFPLPD